MDEQVLFGKYVVKEEIARGGMGILYRAVDRTLNRQVAIKVLHPHLSGDNAFVMRFLREARAMARLDHENIVRIYAVEEQQGTHCLVMEYFPGKNLKQLLDTPQWRPSIRRSLDIMLQITGALAFAHASGLVHRDIKPANILINSQGKAKLTDFGIAAAADEMSLTSAGQILGTPEYMAPEQARGEHMDPRTDLYAMGMVMYELMVGGTPYRHVPKTAILSDLVRPGGELTLEFPLAIPSMARAIVEDLVRRNPQERTPDANTLLTQLRYVFNSVAQSEEAEDGFPRLFLDGGDGTLQMAQPSRASSEPTTPIPGPPAAEPSVTMAKTDVLQPVGTPTPPSLSVPSRTPLHAAPPPPPPSFAERARSYRLLPLGILAGTTVLVLAGVALYLTSWEDPGLNVVETAMVPGDRGGGDSGSGGDAGGSGQPQQQIAVVSDDQEEQRKQEERERREREQWLAEQKAKMDAERRRLAEERERSEREQARLKEERERIERERRLAAERAAAMEAERQRALEEQARREREQQRLQEEQERLRREQELAKEEAEKKRLEEQRAELLARVQRQEEEQKRLKEELEQRLAQERAEKERLAREQAAREREARELEEKLAKELAERDRLLREQEEQERLASKLHESIVTQEAEKRRSTKDQATLKDAAPAPGSSVETTPSSQSEAEPPSGAPQRATEENLVAKLPPPASRPNHRRQLDSLLDSFKTAYEAKDLPAIQRLVVMEPADAKFFRMMFARYATIKVEIAVPSFSEREATAEVKITKLIDVNGESVKPSPILRSKKVRIPREGDRWGKLVW